MSNARKHGEGDIEVSLKRESATIKLELCDDGPGWDLGSTVTYENRSEGGARVTVHFSSVTK